MHQYQLLCEHPAHLFFPQYILHQHVVNDLKQNKNILDDLLLGLNCSSVGQFSG